MRKIKLIIMAGLMICGLSGCEFKQMFVNPEDAYKLSELSDNELIDDSYYVKDSAAFYELYQPEGENVSSRSNRQEDDRIFWLNKDESLIPALYQNEIIAYPSEDTTLSEINMERFKDVGWSIGLYGGYIDEDGYLCYSVKQNCIVDSEAFEVLSDAPSDSIRIVSINDEPVSEDMLDSSGIILGLEENGTYQFNYYSGTKYGTSLITADYKFLQSYEIYSIEKAYTTKNGYLAIYMPEDAQSGYYYLNGYGVFKYYAFKKGESDIAQENMNEPYYLTESEKISAYAQQYFFNVSMKTKNVGVSVYYDMADYTEDDILVIATSPNGTDYTMTNTSNSARLMLEEAMAGRWTVSILPKDLKITDVVAESTQMEDDAQEEVSSFYVGKDKTGVVFYVEYSGKGSVWGIVENEQGEAVMLEEGNEDGMLVAAYSYLPKGTYTMTVYHYNDTKIVNMDYTNDSRIKTEEVLVIEE